MNRVEVELGLFKRGRWAQIDALFEAIDAAGWDQVDAELARRIGTYTGADVDQCPETARWTQRERSYIPRGYGSRGGSARELQLAAARERRAAAEARQATR